jgi:hypothetical protein
MLKIITTQTDNPTNIVRVYSDVERTKSKLILNAEVNDVYKEYVHLHIVDTEAEIVENDWYIWEGYSFNPPTNPKISQLTSHYGNISESKAIINKGRSSKIIASTDTSLGLQSIPQYIIDAYIADNNIELSTTEEGYFYYAKADLSLPNDLDGYENERTQSEPQVDFDLLKDFIDNNLVTSSHSKDYIAKLANVKLFFQKTLLILIIIYSLIIGAEILMDFAIRNSQISNGLAVGLYIIIAFVSVNVIYRLYQKFE